jgi:hypothetical protein
MTRALKRSGFINRRLSTSISRNLYPENLAGEGITVVQQTRTGEGARFSESRRIAHDFGPGIAGGWPGPQ